MSSFLQRLKKKDVIPTTPEDEKKAKVAAEVKASPQPDQVADQLHVDIFKVPGAIIIYAQISGASVNDYSVLIEGDGDVITIKGQRTRPNGEHFQHTATGADAKEKILEECSWGAFYRQVILPSEVDAAKTEAKMREGVLMLYLPLKQSKEVGVRIPVSEI